MRNISDIHKSIENSKGKDVHLKLRGLDQSKTILSRNFISLYKLNQMATDKVELFYLKNREKMEDFQLEFSRLLHNYLSSVMSLIEHTRVMKKKMKLSDAFEELYKSQSIKFFGTKNSIFIQQLRIYVQHYSLLPSGVQLSVQDGGNKETIMLTLDASTLKEFKGWDTESKELLKESPEKMEIFKMIEKYQVSVERFYNWFYSEIEKTFSGELKEFDELAKEYMAHHEKMMQKRNNKSKMGIWDSPLIEDGVVCISDDYALSAQISACFSNQDVFFAVLEPPRSLHKYWENEFVKLNNVLAKIHPQKVIFVNVKDEMVERIKSQLRINKNRYEYLNNQIEVDLYVNKFKPFFKGIIECPPDRKKVAYALLEAKRNKLKLVVRKDAEYKQADRVNVTRKHLVVSDSSDNLLPVTLANYAFSINADLVFLHTGISYKPEEMFNILSDTRGSSHRANNANSIVNDIGESLRLELEAVDKYEVVTFFTDDFPYGFFFPKLPTTHIFNKLLPSHFIADSITSPNIELQSAVLVDPGFFPNSETDSISTMLSKSGVYTKELRDDKFRNSDLDNYIQHYPYDLLFVCSHGNFPKGVEFKIQFSDKNKCDHVITIHTLDEFNPTNKGTGNNRLIGIKTFTEFVELDGQPWYQKKYKKGSSKTVVEDFLALDRRQWKVLEKKDVTMNYCNVIVTKDPISPNYIPMIQSVSDPQSAPFIFNNACVSTYTMSVNIIFAGASFYVGTVKPVKDEVAVKTAQLYFEKSIKQNKSLVLSLWEALNDGKISEEDRVYTSTGCHFKKFVFFPIADCKIGIKQRIKIDVALRLRRIFDGNLETDIKERHGDIVGFLLNEYSKI